MKPDVTAHELARVFDNTFIESENTRMVTGAIEPFYVPQNMRSEFSDGTEIAVLGYHRVFSRADYAASVLHEAAHWCIAGKERRTQLDYGYWYEPDGRSPAQQQEFERVEIKPQALERIFCHAAGVEFRVSVDNVNDASAQASEWFLNAVHEQTIEYLVQNLPDRAARFAKELSSYFGVSTSYLDVGSYNKLTG